MFKHRTIFKSCGNVDIHLTSFKFPLLLVFGHCPDNLFTQSGELPVLDVDLCLQPVTHLPLVIVTGLNRQRLIAESLSAHGFKHGKTPGRFWPCFIQQCTCLLLQLPDEADFLLDFRSFILPIVKLPLRFLQFLFQCGKLCDEGLQNIRGRLKVTLFCFQPGDRKCYRLPVEIAEIRILIKFGEDCQALLERCLLLLQRTDTTCEFGKLLFLSLGIHFKRCDFGSIAPSEYVAAAVVKPVAVILFVAFTR